jgi:hypothetical protein
VPSAAQSVQLRQATRWPEYLAALCGALGMITEGRAMLDALPFGADESIGGGTEGEELAAMRRSIARLETELADLQRQVADLQSYFAALQPEPPERFP